MRNEAYLDRFLEVVVGAGGPGEEVPVEGVADDCAQGWECAAGDFLEEGGGEGVDGGEGGEVEGADLGFA